MNAIVLQMLPLLVFVIVDMIFTNTVVSIVSAVLFALFQMIFTFVKTGSPDYLILIDVGLITALGVISIFLKNDIYFKLKPAIIELIMVVLIIVLTFAPDSFIISYLSRFMPSNMALVPESVPFLKKMFWGMAFYTALHAGAVWYTAYCSSRKVWAVVSGPGYFFIFIPIILFILTKRLRQKRRVVPQNQAVSSLDS